MTRLKAMNGSRETWEDPSEDALFFLLEDIEQGRKKFLIIERVDDPTRQTYIQSIRNEAGEFVVEFRDGSPDQHFGTVVHDLRATHDLITAWSFGRDGWREAADWNQISFDK